MHKGNLIRRWMREYAEFKKESQKSMAEWRLYECVVMYETICWARDVENADELIEWLWKNKITLDMIADWFADDEYVGIRERLDAILNNMFNRFGIDKASRV